MSGYGDYLMLTAVIHNIKLRNPAARVILTNITSKPNKTRNHFGQIIRNNPQIDQYLSTTRTRFLYVRFKNRKDKNVTYVSSNLRKVSPYARVVKGHVTYPFHGHAIEIFCRPYGIRRPELRPRLFLTQEETNNADRLLEKHGLTPGKFIIIEPGTEHQGASKLWPQPYWQEVCKRISQKYPDIRLVQISPYQVELDNVLGIGGETSFREATRLIEKSLTLITTEGGLMHLAASIPKSSIIIYSGYLSPTLMAYPLHINIHPAPDIPCLGCGQRLSCDNGLICMDSIKPDQVIDALEKLIHQPQNQALPIQNTNTAA